MNDFQIGDRVTIHCPNHRQDGKSGPVVYHGQHFGTVGVEIDGRNYGFTPDELTKQEPTHRIEWFGILKVYQPIRPTVHEAAKEAAVSCA